MSIPRIGIIGGSGLYQMEGFSRQKWVKVTTPFGPPSDELLTGELAGRDLRRRLVLRPRRVRARGDGERVAAGR